MALSCIIVDIFYIKNTADFKSGLGVTQVSATDTI